MKRRTTGSSSLSTTAVSKALTAAGPSKRAYHRRDAIYWRNRQIERAVGMSIPELLRKVRGTP